MYLYTDKDLQVDHSHSGDILLLVFVRRRVSCDGCMLSVKNLTFLISSSKYKANCYMYQLHLYDQRYMNVNHEIQDNLPRGRMDGAKFAKKSTFLKIFFIPPKNFGKTKSTVVMSIKTYTKISWIGVQAIGMYMNMYNTLKSLLKIRPNLLKTPLYI